MQFSFSPISTAVFTGQCAVAAYLATPLKLQIRKMAVEALWFSAESSPNFDDLKVLQEALWFDPREGY